MKRKIVALSVVIAMIASIGMSSIAVQASDSAEIQQNELQSEPSETISQATGETEAADGSLSNENQATVETVAGEPENQIGDLSPASDELPDNQIQDLSPESDELLEHDKKEFSEKRLELSALLEVFDETDYTTESWQEFLPVYNAALQVYESGRAETIKNYRAVIDAIDNLLSAQQKLQDSAKVFRIRLGTLLKIGPLTYTAESWQEFCKLIEPVQAVYQNPVAGITELKQAIEDYSVAIDVLVREWSTAKDYQHEVAAMIAFFEPMLKGRENEFTTDAWKSYQEALTAGYALQKIKDPTYEEAERIMDQMYAAVSLLEISPASRPVNGDRALLSTVLDYSLMLTKLTAYQNIHLNITVKLSDLCYKAQWFILMPGTSQFELDQTWLEIETSIFDFNIVSGDPGYLAQLIAGAETVNTRFFSKADQQKVAQAIEAAKQFDAGATNQQRKTAAQALLDTLNHVSTIANTRPLMDALEKANQLDLSNCTEDSVKDLTAAKTAAQALLDDETLTSDRQKEVDAVTESLLNAMDSLEYKNTPAPGGGEPSSPVQEGGVQEQKKGNTKSNSPKTEDTNAYPLAAVGFTALSLSGIAWIKRKKLEEETQ